MAESKIEKIADSDLLPQDQIFRRLQECSDLKSEAKTPRISLSRSVIRPRAYLVRYLRLCRIEFSVHTGLGPYHPYQKDAVRSLQSSVERQRPADQRSSRSTVAVGDATICTSTSDSVTGNEQ